MKLEKIEKAEQEARRFLETAIAARKRIKHEQQCADSEYAIICTKETGACRRASLDLSRALAELRSSK